MHECIFFLSFFVSHIPTDMSRTPETVEYIFYFPALLLWEFRGSARRLQLLFLIPRFVLPKLPPSSDTCTVICGHETGMYSCICIHVYVYIHEYIYVNTFLFRAIIMVPNRDYTGSQ